MKRLDEFKSLIPEPTKASLRGALLVAAVAVCLAVFLAWRSVPTSERLAPSLGQVGVLAGSVSDSPMVGAQGLVARTSAGSSGVFADESTQGSNSPFEFGGVANQVGAPSSVFVHVLGAVLRPGVFELPAGSRAVAALSAAGGLREGAGLGGVNLARPLVDGEQIYFGPKARVVAKPDDLVLANPAALSSAKSAASSLAKSTSAAKSSVSASLLINLNTATTIDLETLPGIGPALAGRIIAFRAKHGGFSAVADLNEVAGIGPKRLDDIAPFVTV